MNKPEIPAPILSPQFFANTTPVYAWLREHDPVHKIEMINTWFVSRHADAVNILDDNENFSVEGMPVSQAWAPEVQSIMRTLFMDDPDHARLRGVVDDFFKPSAVKKREAKVQQIIDDAIAEIAESGDRTIDLQKQFAYTVPIDVLSMILGLPKNDFELFHAWAPRLNSALMPFQTEEQRADGAKIAIEVRDYLLDLLRSGQVSPDGDETVMSLLVDAVNNGTMTEDELAPQAVQLYIGGHETTLHLIGLTLHALLTHPEEKAKVMADPSRAIKAAEETVRWDGVSHGIGRRVVNDYSLHGVTMKANDMLFVGNASANRDPEVFENPDAFDLDRKGRAAHLGFGRGLRYCLGQNLAKLETRLAVVSFFEAFPDAALVDGFVPEYGQNLMMRGHTTMPVNLYGEA